MRYITETKPCIGTYEWGYKTANLGMGCPHMCRYCYARSRMSRFNKRKPEQWSSRFDIYDDKPHEDPTKKKIDGRVMFPSTHDIFPGNLKYVIDYVAKILEHENEILITSKPHLDCIQEICRVFRQYRDLITFRFTIGSVDDEILRFWEPGAPGFDERMESMKYAFNQGFRTSVSCEPMLDFNVSNVVNAVKPYVNNTIWIGKMNRIKSNLTNNHEDDPEVLDRCLALEEWSNDEKNIRGLWERWGSDPMIRWKDSNKQTLKLPRPEIPGSDI